MSTTIVTRAHHEFTPLTTPRMCRDELKHLTLEIRRSEKVDRFTAQRQAIRMLSELDAYREEWDRLAYLKGNRAGLPF